MLQTVISRNVKRATDQPARFSQATMDTVSRSAGESSNETSAAAKEATDRGGAVGESITETAAETANAATNTSFKTAEQSRKVMMMGMWTAAGDSSKVAGFNFGCSRHMMPSAANAMDIYRDASERTAKWVQALFSSPMSNGRSLQNMQHAWLEMINHSLEYAAHKPQDLLRSTNIVELAGVQHNLYTVAINYAIESTSRPRGTGSRAPLADLSSLRSGLLTQSDPPFPPGNPPVVPDPDEPSPIDDPPTPIPIPPDTPPEPLRA